MALGISDTYALGVLAEAVGLPTPVVMLPFVNAASAGGVHSSDLSASSGTKESGY